MNQRSSIPINWTEWSRSQLFFHELRTSLPQHSNHPRPQYTNESLQLHNEIQHNERHTPPRNHTCSTTWTTLSLSCHPHHHAVMWISTHPNTFFTSRIEMARSIHRQPKLATPSSSEQHENWNYSNSNNTIAFQPHSTKQHALFPLPTTLSRHHCSRESTFALHVRICELTWLSTRPMIPSWIDGFLPSLTTSVLWFPSSSFVACHMA